LIFTHVILFAKETLIKLIYSSNNKLRTQVQQNTPRQHHTSKMSINNTVLIIGGTSGIGAALAHAIHSQGKKVIVTGRRADRLTTLAASLPGLEPCCFDFSDIDSLPANIHALTTKFPDIDTVIVAAGVQSLCLMNDPELSKEPNEIAGEVNTNLVAPMVLSQLLVPFFLAKRENQCSLIFISSGFAFVPITFFPIYSPTKAGMHSFAIALRSQLSGTNVNVVEVFPPYVATELDIGFKEKMVELMGGKVHPPMSLEEFTDLTMKGLQETENGKPKAEVPIGDFPILLNQAWRGAFSGTLQMIGVKG
jgi:short-subunit dehydrogenase involved in D-alanine esterification of teichoic acids